ncbi:MAG TPA: hypothetical protein VHN74_01705 [Candidatus Angelobacter sp.]|jgi:hypothetical protein|nr:hypothetical protein [Candidatus Angelobacter sp.]
MASLLKKIAICRHDRSTFLPVYGSNERPPAGFRTPHGTFCLTCGEKLDSDWQDITVIEVEPSRNPSIGTKAEA